MNHKFINYFLKVFLVIFLYLISNISLFADCRICPEIVSVKILLKNGVIRKGHIAINPEEELGEKPDRSLEVFRRMETLRLFLSLESLTLLELNDKTPHILHDKVYMDILYKDIAKIELLEKNEK